MRPPASWPGRGGYSPFSRRCSATRQAGEQKRAGRPRPGL